MCLSQAQAQCACVCESDRLWHVKPHQHASEFKTPESLKLPQETCFALLSLRQAAAVAMQYRAGQESAIVDKPLTSLAAQVRVSR